MELIALALGLPVWLGVVMSETKAHDEMQLEMSTNGKTVPVLVPGPGHQTGWTHEMSTTALVYVHSSRIIAVQ